MDNVHPFRNFVITIAVIVGMFSNAYVTNRNGFRAFSFNRLGPELKQLALAVITTPDLYVCSVVGVSAVAVEDIIGMDVNEHQLVVVYLGTP